MSGDTGGRDSSPPHQRHASLSKHDKSFTHMSHPCVFYYYIPTDGDTPINMNAFFLNKQRHKVTLRDIKKHFPLPGTYHFRFKVKNQELTTGNTSYVWLDMMNEEEVVPLFEHKIIAKVLRLSWDCPEQYFQRCSGGNKFVATVSRAVTHQDGEDDWTKRSYSTRADNDSRKNSSASTTCLNPKKEAPLPHSDILLLDDDSHSTPNQNSEAKQKGHSNSKTNPDNLDWIF